MFSAGRMAVVNDGQHVCDITEVEGTPWIGDTAEKEVRVSRWGEQFAMVNKFVIGTSPAVVGLYEPDIGTDEAFEGE